MIMVKAFAYGSGSSEIANRMQFHHIDYLAVAYADEGVALRKDGIELPIMVMNPNEESLQVMIQYNLEPEVYSNALLKKIIQIGKPVNIHIKLDTGMHRLGFVEDETDQLIEVLKANDQVSIKSIFTHLAGQDEEQHDQFSKAQVRKFESEYQLISERLGINPVKHVLNSAGILRYAEYHFDMVRLGIGLYGIETNKLDQSSLLPISTLKTTISQIKKINKGESVGYSRAQYAENDTIIATIPIGYADGFDRRFSNGMGYVLVNGKKAPVIGNVCMDMAMVDISEIEASEGDEVVIFGPDLPIVSLAEIIGIIPYEIHTNISSRVKRIFISEN